MSSMIWLIPLAPLAASLLLAFLGNRWFREMSHAPCIAAIGVSFLCSLGVLLFGDVAQTPRIVDGYEWLSVGDLVVQVRLQVDALSAMMLVMVTFISLLVAIYSAGYMHGDPGYPRFFAEISLFVFSMTMLVLAANLILLYVFWEAVGLCSYLLIGFWFRRPSAAAAAQKAFLVNRIGDFGFAIGIFSIWMLVGGVSNWTPIANSQLLDYANVFTAAPVIAEQHPLALTAACLLLFAGAVGKSAQFPLHVWLPDAMEGPTPVSALIHAATMVTAGVYMVARCSPLFQYAPEAQVIVAGIGSFTALLAAAIAVTQFDLKRVLAYSTVSQLGLMFLALGAAVGGDHIRTVAVVAAMFHLFTHAFFKALLFLGSGSVMHAMGNVIDMRRFSGLRHIMPETHWTFLVGAATLAGLPPFSGFWSKDEILAVVGEATHTMPYGGYFSIFQDVAAITSLLTAFYIFRAYLLTFHGPKKIPYEAGSHAHESPATMTTPLWILAGFAAAIGGLLGPTHTFFHYLSHAPGLGETEAPGLSPAVMGFGATIGLVGAGAAWLLYGRSPGLAESFANSLRQLRELSANKFWFDEIYALFILTPIRWLASVCDAFDRTVIDRILDTVGGIPSSIGRLLRTLHAGQVHGYVATMVAGIVLLAMLIVVWT